MGKLETLAILGILGLIGYFVYVTRIEPGGQWLFKVFGLPTYTKEELETATKVKAQVWGPGAGPFIPGTALMYLR